MDLTKLKSINLRPLHILVLVVYSLLSVTLVLLLVHEWIVIGVMADPDVISRYYFGSESMVGHGGFMYKSAGIYAWSAFLIALLVLVPFTCFVIGVTKKRKKAIVIGYYTLPWWLIAKILCQSHIFI